ncbi:MAG: primosomal protein N' [Saprospiraceae bacterium]
MSSYADIILPLALPKRTYTYSIPESILDIVKPGVRVEIQFGRTKVYSGLVEKVHNTAPDYKVKPIVSVLDQVTVVSPEQFKLWNWLAEYYCCSLGEVMAAALPGHMKLSSETRIVRNEAYGDDFSSLNPDEYLIAEALHIQEEISVDDARKILNKKTVFPVIQSLINYGVLFLREDLQEKFKAKKISAIRLGEPFASKRELLKEVFAELQKKERQLEILMSFLVLEKEEPFVRKFALLQKADVSDSSLRTMIKKGIFEQYDQDVSRLGGYEDELAEADVLSTQQSVALVEIEKQLHEKDVVLLHGVTGSGKTRVYLELIKKVMEEGGQVLYLLPEIALTSQMISRLQKTLGNEIAVYHSKINTNERVEVWKAAFSGKPVMLAARSGLFLPFTKLKLVIVDEEHDPSFKQFDPAPRYHARDTAIYLANLYGAKVVLGTATPSLETWQNAQTGKYGLVDMPERFGGLNLPEISTVDLRQQLKSGLMKSVFSTPLLENIEGAIADKKQVILFQNRRGYAPMLECQVCGWNAECKNCDVSLTYHKQTNRLRCHYCGYTESPASTCPACGSGKIVLKGFGTEKIEDELKLFLPNARIGRMDLDTAGSKSGLSAILNDFEECRVDVLVGTQMVTKGLDFENVAYVGVLGADGLIKFPDFRSGERTFQLLTQVAGRAGRKHEQGRVQIQAFDPDHPIIKEVLKGDYKAFAERELKERFEFKYPPFYRLIQISIRHKDPEKVKIAAAFFGRTLREKLGERVLGPVIPNIARVRSYFGQDILVKLEKSTSVISAAKNLIKHTSELAIGKTGFSQLIVVIDVDPM